MKQFVPVLIALLVLQACSSKPEIAKVNSPDESISIQAGVNSKSQLYYLVKLRNSVIIDTSYIDFEFQHQLPLKNNLKIVDAVSSSFNETWEMPWGEQRYVKNNYNELILKLKETTEPYRKFDIVFRAFDDGIGFRYVFHENESISEVTISDENTRFNLTGDHTCWWIPGDWDIYEHLYNTTKLTEIDAIAKRNHSSLAQTYIPENAVNTPVTMRTDDGVHLSFHEANLTDYAGMTLKIDKDNLSMTSELVGSKEGWKVKRSLPFATPWRTIQISDDAACLIESKLIINLNEPNKLGDVSWFKPMKYVGIWWEMHVGKSTWDYGQTQDMNSFTGANPHGKHGATTENAMRYIDFAAENGLSGILVEGWNTGWEHWIGFEDREGVFDFVTPYPDYDLNKVVEYGNSKGVELIMHHETSAAVPTYDQQLDTAYALMQRLGIHSVKTGYVGKIIPKGEYHHGQYMVNHYRKVLETAAKYNIAINAHEPIKATGIRRTLPNAISREGLRGQEFNAWSADGGNPPEHLTIVPFTRMLAGPIDFTPGIFNIKLEPYKENNQVNTTLAHQLALYVVLYSPIQMVPDLPEHYEGNAAFQFIRDVAVDWDETKVLNGEVGEFVTIARKERDSDNWFVGAVSDENSRSLNISLKFLDAGKTYKAIIYRDGEYAHWDKNPTDFAIDSMEVTSESSIELKLAEGGGAAISLMPIK